MIVTRLDFLIEDGAFETEASRSLVPQGTHRPIVVMDNLSARERSYVA